MGTRLWARCVHGLEPVAAAEAVTRLGATNVESRPRSLFFDVSDASGAGALMTVDDALVLLGTVDGIGSTRRDLSRLTRGIDGMHVEMPSAAVDVTASFVGRRTYNRYDVEEAVGERLAARFGATYTSRRAGDRPPSGAASVRIHIEGETAFVGLRISDHPLHRRAYKRQSVPGTLHPPVAAALSIFGGLAPGDVVVDPTCGVATTVIEAARWTADVRALGMDASPVTITAAAENVRDAGVAVGLICGDAGAAPLREGSADLVVTNPPWGRQAGALGSLRSGPGLFWRELERIVRDGGRVVALAEEGLESGLDVAARVPLSLMGAHPIVTVYGAEAPSPEHTIRALLLAARPTDQPRASQGCGPDGVRP